MEKNAGILRIFSPLLLFAGVWALSGTTHIFAQDNFGTMHSEPNATIASAWWPELTNVWTPIGWQDHLFRFNVVYDGTLVGVPHPAEDLKLTAPWEGRGIQLTFLPTLNGALPPARSSDPYPLTRSMQRRYGDQGLLDRPTPVLWTRWRQTDMNEHLIILEHGMDRIGSIVDVDSGQPQTGLVLRQEIFSHIPGADDVETGTEPLFAWIRLSVEETLGQTAPERCGFLIRVNAPHLGFSMSEAKNLTVVPQKAPYLRELIPEPAKSEPDKGMFLIEPDGKVRLALQKGQAKHWQWTDLRSAQPDAYLYVVMDAKPGEHVDLLVPMIPAPRDVINKELTLGFDGALAQCDRYWSRIPSTAAHITTPEPEINEAIERSLQFARIISTRIPESDQASLLSGSLVYAKLWATPTSMANHMLLDPLGYHEDVERYLELFRNNQGTVKPPGPALDLHPGYFSTPKNLTSIDWLSDHGAILYTIAYHGLLTGDREFIDHWLESILKACEFIRDARAIETPDGAPGILPPAIPTDDKRLLQAVWSDGWNYKGLTTAVRLLKRIDHPRAVEFDHEAQAYREAFVKAFRAMTEQMPTWTDASGQVRPIVPTSCNAGGGDYLFPFYLDTGPLFCVYAGLLDADDELMRTALAYFREGPTTRVHDRFGHWRQPSVLIHEISSCEPCYSWNIFHSYQTGDRNHYLEGMYSLFTGALSRQTYISCETRGGVTGNIFASPLAIYLARLAVIDDIWRPDEIHLLRLVPLAWLNSEKETRLERMPTEYGPLTIHFAPSKDGQTLRVDIEIAWRSQPVPVVLHLPPLENLKRVILNGQAIAAAAGDQITLPITELHTGG
jgi:hypothetical protein